MLRPRRKFVTIKVPQAVQSCHEALLWFIPHLDKFPRLRRFTLGERLESGLLDVLEALTAAAFSPGRSRSGGDGIDGENVGDKAKALRRANLRLQTVRHLWRLCHELKVIPTQRFAHGARLLERIGQQVGGWLKTVG
jgi:hypothetical protein